MVPVVRVVRVVRRMIGGWITNSQNIKQKDVIMPFCGECGAEVPAGVNFCGKCGASAGVARSAPPDDAQINFDEFKDKTLFWKKPAYVVLGVIGVVLLIAAVTNPSEWKHRRAVAALVYNEFSKTDEGMIVDGVLGILGDKSGSVGTAFTANTLRSKITSRNYVFFSLTTVIESGGIIGVGAFGNVYLFEDTLPDLGGDNDDERQKVAAPKRRNNTGSAQSNIQDPILRGFSIQIMADGDIDIIRKEKNKAQTAINKPVFIVFIEPYYKLWVGDFNTKAQAEEILPEVKRNGYKDAWIVNTASIKGSIQGDVSTGKVDNRLWGTETEWCNDDICIWFMENGAYHRWNYRDADVFYYEGTWNTSGNNITITDKGGTITGSYSVNRRGHDRILRINNEEYIDKWEGDD